MFSSLGTSLSNLYNSTTSVIRSPKAILASYLSQSLAEFFQVDSQAIETNLVTDAHVSLRNVQIQPRILSRSGQTVVSGTVELLDFRWQWGGGAGTEGKTGVAAYITNVRLIVSGVQIRIAAASKEEFAAILAMQQEAAASSSSSSSSTATSDTSTHATKTPTTTTNGGSDWKARYLQQILDHLTFEIADVKIVVDLVDSNNSQEPPLSLHLEGSSMELLTLGRDVDESLSQRIRVGSITSYLKKDDDDGTKLPLLDPIGYRAKVQRVSGRRFLDGMANGLEISGEQILAGLGSGAVVLEQHQTTAPNAIRLHAGVMQMKCLLRLQEMLSIVDTTTTAAAVPVVQEDSAASLAPPVPCAKEKDKNDSESKNRSSLFVLPIQWMALVLGENTEVKLEGCTIRYRTDGSECSIQGTSGVLLDGVPLSEPGLGTVVLDLVQQRLQLVPSSNNNSSDEDFVDAQEEEETEELTKTVIKLECRKEQLEKLVNSVKGMLTLWNSQSNDDTMLAEQDVLSSTPSANTSPWYLSVLGTITCRVAVANDQWLDLALSSLSLRSLASPSTDSLPCWAEWSQLAIDTSHGASIRIPALSTASDHGLSLSDTVHASLTSLDDIPRLQELFKGLVSMYDLVEELGESPTYEKKKPSSAGPLPLPVMRIPSSDITIQGSGSIRVGLVEVKGHNWSCEDVVVDGFLDPNAVFKVETISACMDSNRAEFCLSKIKLPGVGHLVNPVNILATRFLGTDDSSSPQYALSTKDTLSCRIGVSAKRWIEFSCTTPFVQYMGETRHDDNPFRCHWASMNIPSSSYGDSLSVHVPAGGTSPDGQSLTIEGLAEATIPSIAAVNDVQALLEEVVSRWSIESLEGSSESRDFPIKLLMPDGIKLTLLGDQPSKVRVKNVEENGVHWMCDEVAVDIVSLGSSLLVKSFEAQLSNTIKAEFSLSSFSVLGVGSLVSPIERIAIDLDTDTIDVKCSYIRATQDVDVNEMAIETANDSNATNGDLATLLLEFPYDICIAVEGLALQSSGTAKQVLDSSELLARFESIEVHVTRRLAGQSDPSEVGTLCLGTSCKSIDFQVPSTLSASFHGLEANVTLGRTRSKESPFIPGLGYVTCATAALNAVEAISIPGAGFITRPLHSTAVSLHEGVVVVDLDYVSWQVDVQGSARGNTIEDKKSQDKVPHSKVPSFPIQVHWKRLLLSGPSLKGAPPNFFEFQSSSILYQPLLREKGAEAVIPLPIALEGASWSTSVKGELSCRVGASSGQWLDWTAESPSIRFFGSSSSLSQIGTIEPNLPIAIGWKSVTVSASSCGDIKIQIPCGKSSSDGKALALEGSIEAFFPSTDAICEVQALVQDALSLFKDDELVLDPLAEAVGDKIPIFPLNLIIPVIQLSVEGPQYGFVCISDLEGFGRRVTCSEITTNGFFGTPGASIKLSKIEAEMLSFLSGRFTVSEFCIPGVVHLSHPIAQVTTELRDETLLVTSTAAIGSFCWDGEDGASAPSSNGIVEATLPKLPFDIMLSVEVIEVASSNTDSPASVCCSGLNVNAIRACQTGSYSKLALKLECKLFSSDFPNLASVCVDYPVVELEMQNPQQKSDHGGSASLCFPGLGEVTSLTGEIKSLAGLSVPSTGKLTQPINDIMISLDNGTMTLSLNSVEWIMAHHSQPRQKAKSPTMPPFQCIVVNARNVVVDRSRADGTTKRYFSCLDCQIVLEPSGQHPSTATLRIPRALDFHYLNMALVPSLAVDTVVDTGRLDTFAHASISIEKIELIADFSSSSWADALEGDDTTEATLLPYASVSGFDLTLNFTGKIVSLDNAKIRLAAFTGDDKSTSQSMTTHYTKLVKKRLPFLLSKADVLGTNFGDSMASIASTAAMRSTVAGSVVGVAGRDAVGAAITRGKSARGATESDRYHFGDLSRGLAASVGSAAKAGASMRGDDQYAVGDFSAGATKAAAEYSSENRVRLSSAGGSSLGMVVGMAAAGPLGLIAGAVIGGKAAATAMEKTLGDPKKKKTNPSPAPSVLGGMETETETLSRSYQTTVLQYQPNQPSGYEPPTISASGSAPVPQPPMAVQPFYNGDQDPLSIFSSMPPTTSTTTYPVGANEQIAHNPFEPFGHGQSTPGGAAVAAQPSSRPSQQPNVQDSYGAYSGSATIPPPAQAFQSNTIQSQVVVAHSSSFIPPTHTTDNANYSTNQAHGTYGNNQQHLPQQYQPAAGSSGRPSPTVQNPAQRPHNLPVDTTASSGNRSAATQQEGYRFGDITRGVVARGKQSRGKDTNSSYKFGDFTRGLFGK